MNSNLFVILITAFTICSGFKNQSSTNTLTVSVSDIRNNKGEIECFIFDKKEGFPNDRSKIYRSVRKNITNGSCELVIENLPHGTYAIGVFHDENNNKKLDKTFYGKPTEGVGINNMPKLGVFNSPNFDKAKMELKGSKEISITLTYL